MTQRWFLSYHTPEKDLAERLKAAIERNDPTSHVFFAPMHMRGGGFWSAQLSDEIAQATAFILLVGQHGIGDWQVLEYDEALERRVKSDDFPVILVLLEGQTAPGLPFLRRLHWIVSSDPTADKEVSRLFDAVSGRTTRPGELWRYTCPYRGLSAMGEKDSDYFFGRKNETALVLKMLANAPDQLPVLLGNSGVGKSSLAQAGVLASLKRQAWSDSADEADTWPHAFASSRRWLFLTVTPGSEPLRSLVEAFLDTWQIDSVSTEWSRRRNEWMDGLRGSLTLKDLLDQTRRRFIELQRPEPPAFFMYIDQGEELYVRAAKDQARCFSSLLASALRDPRFFALMSLRSDFLGELQRDEALFSVHQKIDVPPLREADLREVVSRPAALLGARFQPGRLAADIARRAADESAKDAAELPLLSYLLDDMWTQMINRGDGELRLPTTAIELGGVLAERADAFIDNRPGAEQALKRLLTLKLATVRTDGEPTRRRALRSEFSEDEWQLVSELANHPHRLLVTASAIEGGQTYAEVAHEAIFRRWQRLREWINTEREFLAWRSGLEAARRAWQGTPDKMKHSALLMGFALSQAQSWFATRSEDIPEVDREFVKSSQRSARRRKLRTQVLLGSFATSAMLAFAAWDNETYLRGLWRWLTVERPYSLSEIRPYVLTPAAEAGLKPSDVFRECTEGPKCPDMVVVPAGSFEIGSPTTELGHQRNEEPRHHVSFAVPFAVSKYAVTFDQWDTCVAYGDCDPHISDSGFGRNQRPVINVTWDDAQRFVHWLARSTGKPYRLLTEAEREYAARSGSEAAYFWGDQVGKENANCDGCSSEWGGKQTAPVGSFAANKFGFYDMLGNVWEWVEDCYQNRYDLKGGPPTDGSAWITDDCNYRVLRGGSWTNNPRNARAAVRISDSPGFRGLTAGSVSHELSPPRYPPWRPVLVRHFGRAITDCMRSPGSTPACRRCDSLPVGDTGRGHRRLCGGPRSHVGFVQRTIWRPSPNPPTDPATADRAGEQQHGPHGAKAHAFRARRCSRGSDDRGAQHQHRQIGAVPVGRKGPHQDRERVGWAEAGHLLAPGRRSAATEDAEEADAGRFLQVPVCIRQSCAAKRAAGPPGRPQ